MEKVPDGGSGFLLGVLAIPVVFTTVKRGEVVVDCVVNVVGGPSLLWSHKMGQGFEVYF